MVLCTAPDEATAEKRARGLVEARLAACVNAVSGVKSFYRWQGKIEADPEIQLVIKTQRGRFDEVASWLQEHHPYDVPEIVAVPIIDGGRPYLDWVAAETGAATG